MASLRYSLIMHLGYAEYTGSSVFPASENPLSMNPNRLLRFAPCKHSRNSDSERGSQGVEAWPRFRQGCSLRADRRGKLHPGLKGDVPKRPLDRCGRGKSADRVRLHSGRRRRARHRDRVDPQGGDPQAAARLNCRVSAAVYQLRQQRPQPVARRVKVPQ